MDREAAQAEAYLANMSLSEFASGALFAVGLFASGVYSPNVIRSQMDFSSNVMIMTMMGASAVSAIVFDVLDRLKLAEKKPRAPSNLGYLPYDGNILGGILLGIGMAATGACPGTSLVQAGVGIANGVFVVIGGLVGAMTFLKLRSALEQAQPDLEDATILNEQEKSTSNTTSKRPLDIATALGVPPLVVLLLWIPMCLAVMRLAFAKDYTVREIPNSALVSPAYGGLLIGAAQLATMLLTGHAIGSSGGYEDIARWIDRDLGSNSCRVESKEALLTPSVIFSAGVVCSAVALAQIMPGVSGSGPEVPWLISPANAAQAIAGGWAMILGSRIAGGCTSGHGISGLAKFSLASLVTIASLFTAGIATAHVMG
ncbi:hypothetical protein LTR37_019777 [Vermiconidia calcicola]|uniref:Uncharacterized protein n=1 Tax=Vermiconidia calcicola TaxID=1690605 RepID=A0ACC3MDI6_9PEZI|nr:hypothetical protein LTR37_019777 [Vermiconidia calcicola]